MNFNSPEAQQPDHNVSGPPIQVRSRRHLGRRLCALAGVTLIGLSATAAIVWSPRPEPPAIVDPPVSYTATPVELDIPFGLPALEIPAKNPLTAEKIALGKQLFFDANLSLDRTISCASCHDPNRGWSNGQPVAEGVGGAKGTRNVPTLFNVAYNRSQFWDGRAMSLESQALGPVLNPVEMAMPSRDALVERIRENGEYRTLFTQAFEDGITATNIARALACFERSILVGNAPFDRYQAGDEQAMSESAIRGWQVFQRKGRCAKCHSAPTFIDIGFHNIGVGMDRPNPDLGVFIRTQRESTRGAFKPPTLRELTKTAPYMHDGSMATLPEVIDFYDKGGVPNPQLSDEVRQLRLTPQEKQDLLEFLVQGLSS